jgi:hypothetical protein
MGAPRRVRSSDGNKYAHPGPRVLYEYVQSVTSSLVALSVTGRDVVSLASEGDRQSFRHPEGGILPLPDPGAAPAKLECCSSREVGSLPSKLPSPRLRRTLLPRLGRRERIAAFPRRESRRVELPRRPFCRQPRAPSAGHDGCLGPRRHVDEEARVRLRSKSPAR